MKNIFRSVEFWKSSLLKMPDNSFFELLRNALGKSKTNLQKQQLVNELESFLLREDIQNTIAAYIDQNDAKVIAATALFGEPVPGELESFFSGEFSYAQLQDIIVNLEERFILYRFHKEKTGGKLTPQSIPLALNPVLEQILLPFTADISVLFPSAGETETSQGERAAGAEPPPSAKREGSPPETVPSKIFLNDLIIAGLFSFVQQWDSFFRTEGVMRKRVADAAKTCFPGLEIKLIIGSLQVLGLFYEDNDRLVPDSRQFSGFCSLSARERMEYCAASLLIIGEQKSFTDILPPLFRSRIKELTGFIHCFTDSLEPEILYSEKSLKKLAEVLKTKLGVNITCSALLETAEKTGLIVTVSPGLKKTGAICGAKTEKNTDTKKKFIKINQDFSIIVFPGINFADAIFLAGFMNVHEAGETIRFELSRDSAVRSFDKNISAEEIIKLLIKLSDGEIDGALVTAVNEWEKFYKEVSLVKGIVLTLSENRRYLAETRPLKNLICETAAPGVYLLPENAMEDAASALRSAGVEIFARRQIKTGNVTSFNNYFSPLSSYDAVFDMFPARNKKSFKTDCGAVKNADKAAALRENFHAILKKTPLSKIEKAELSARINRRLVLCEAQIKEPGIHYEKLEARHMDYAGKQNIAKQAIAQQSPVEIVLPGENEERIFGVPKALEKENEELILVIDLTASGHKNEDPSASMPPESLPVISREGNGLRRIPLGRISFLRRIKKSIFI